MITAMTIRPAELSDAISITRIYNQGIEDRGATFETAARRIQDIQARIADAAYPLLVATQASGEVLGWAGLSPYRERACYAGIAEFSIYVAHGARGRGMGRQLLMSLIEVARTKGFWKLVSRIFPFNIASRAVCRACGFREVGFYEKHAQLDGRWLDVVIVERRLIDAPVGIAPSVHYSTASQLEWRVDASGAKFWGVALEKTSFTRFECEPGSRFPAHEHASEQITHVLSGTLYFDIDDQTYRVRAGDVIAIPGHVVHAVYTLSEPCVAVDAWSPVMPRYRDISPSVSEDIS